MGSRIVKDKINIYLYDIIDNTEDQVLYGNYRLLNCRLLDCRKVNQLLEEQVMWNINE